MRSTNAARTWDQTSIEFADDELDLVLGELDHAIDQARKRGTLLYRYDPAPVEAALAFFARRYARLDLRQSKPDFEAVRMRDEEWARRFREKILRICADPMAKLDGWGLPQETRK